MKKVSRKDTAEKAKESKSQASASPDRYDPKEAEPRLQRFWQEQNIFKFNPKSKKPIFSIDTPPPTISGLIHIGHAMSYSQAEFVARFWRMQGYEIFYPMGFDDNGLPTERYVEKKRGIKATDMTRKEFINICLEETKKGGDEFRKVWEDLGISVDWSLLYSTINPLCQKISQFSFLDLLKKGRIYRQEGPVTWCPLCQTAIAQAELEDAQRKAYLYTIIFASEGGNIEIATTRPELLAACVAIFVHPEDKRYKKLVGKRVIVPLFGQDVPILADESVDQEFGTGIVMVCTFGDKQDIDWWKRHSLPTKIVIDKLGKLNNNAGKFSGLKLGEAKEKIIEELQNQKLITEKKEIMQNINVHERCGTPVEIFISPQWYVRILDMKEKLLELGDQITWYPEHMKIRYKQWVEGLNADWCISRQRFYGIPFPVWYCKKCGETIFADEKELPVDPLEENPGKKCSCGSSEFEPEKDVIDTWATSAVTPLINAKWREKDSIIEKIYPMSLRPQAHDIIRTWMFYTITKCWLHTGKLPWTTIMISGHGLDPKGKKMSKSKGNVVEPLEVKEKYSADAVRFWATSASLGEDLPYKEKDVLTGQRLLTKLWNASKFVGLNLKDYKLRNTKKENLTIIDRWILSKLMRLVDKTTDGFKICEYSQAKTDTEIFFWHEFCDNYLEMVKHRLYSGDKADKTADAAKYTLYKSLLTMLKLFAPIIPHVTEEIYQKIFRKQEKDISLHISAWPKFEKEFVDEKAEELGEIAKQIIAALRQYKSAERMPLNAELQKIVIDCDSETQKKIEVMTEDICGTMKVKKIEFGKARQIVLDKIRINVHV